MTERTGKRGRWENGKIENGQVGVRTQGLSHTRLRSAPCTTRTAVPRFPLRSSPLSFLFFPSAPLLSHSSSSPPPPLTPPSSPYSSLPFSANLFFLPSSSPPFLLQTVAPVPPLDGPLRSLIPTSAASASVEPRPPPPPRSLSEPLTYRHCLWTITPWPITQAGSANPDPVLESA